MRNRFRYLPIIEVEAGMVLALPVNVVNHGVLRLSMPAGFELTDDSVHQLIAHRAEFIYVIEPDRRTDEKVASDAAAMAGRVLHVFAGADLADPVMAALFDQVVIYRSA